MRASSGSWAIIVPQHYLHPLVLAAACSNPEPSGGGPGKARFNGRSAGGSIAQLIQSSPKCTGKTDTAKAPLNGSS
jgi:hypothetical protein